MAEEKVKMHFCAVGSARQMRETKYQMAASSKFASVQSKLRKMLQLKPTDALFLFINSSFVPNSSDTLGNLFENFKTGNELIINYCEEIAWG
jgi:ubiquitin-like protein ATG12